MAGKSFSVSFNINGSLDGSLQAALNAAANAMRGLGNAAKSASAAAAASKAGLAGMASSLGQLQAAAQRYKQIQDALKQSTTDFSLAGQKLASAKAKYEADAAAAEKLKASLDALKKAQARALSTKNVQLNGLKIAREDLANLKRAYELAKRAGDQSKMSSLDAQIKSTQAAVAKQQEVVKQAAQAYKELSEKVKQAKAELKAANEAAQKSGSDLSAARSNTQRLSQNFQSQLSALNQLKASLSAAGFNVSSFAASESRLAGDIDRVNAALRQQQALMNAQSQSARASQEMFNAYNNFQGALNTAQQIAQPFQNAAENAMDFEYAMSKVKSLTQMRDIRAGNIEKVDAAMQRLTETAENLGATTEFTSTKIAQSMGKLGMAGWDEKKINAAMPSIVDLATIAGNGNIDRTADIVSDDMTALGIKAGESLQLAGGKVVDGMKYFSDAFAYATTQANLDQELLHEALKYNAPTGKSAGLSLGEIFAMNMVSANAGIKGSMAGTSFRAGWVRFLAPPKTAQKALEQMGNTASDATKQIMEAQAALTEAGASDSDDLMTKITKAQQYYQTLDKTARAGWLKNLVGQNALSGWQIAFEKGNFSDIIKFAKEIDLGTIEGWAADTATVMRDNTKTSVELLNSSFDALQRSVGQALTPAIRAAADAFAPMVTAASEFIAQNPAIVQAAAAIAAALASIVVGAAAVKLAFAGWKFVTSSILLVQEALKALAGGQMMTGLIAKVTALRTALFGLGGAATLGGWSAMFAAISARATAAAAAIRTFFASLTLGSMGSGIVATLSSIGTAIAGAARAAMAFAFSPVGVALMALALAGMYVYQNWDKVSAVFSRIAGIITGALSPAITQIQTALSALSSSGGFAALSNAASQAASVIGGTLVKAFLVVLTVAASAIAGIIQLLADLITIIADIGTGLADAIGKISEGDFSGAFDALTSAGSKAFTDLQQMGNHVFDGVEQGAKNVQAVIDALNSNATVASQAATSAGSNMGAGLLAATPAPQVTAPETAPIDTSATQAALDQVGDSASNAASQMQSMQQATAGVDQMATQFAAAGTGVEQLATSAQQAGTGVQQFSTNAQQAGTAAQTFGTSAQNAATGADALGASAQNATSGIEALSSSAAGAVGSVTGLGSAASSAAGALSGLGAAVQAACAQLASAGASAAAAVASAGGGVKANYKGGIYPKGQFLTTFAEKSPEAAIPIDNSKRARELWTKTGQMLGMLPGSGGGYDSAEKDALGNVVGMDIPEYNRIGEGDTEDVKIAKRRVQREQYDRERADKKIAPQVPTIATPEISASQIQPPQIEQPEIQKQAIEITRAVRENYIRQRLGGLRRSPTVASSRRLQQTQNRQQRIDDVVFGRQSLDGAINDVKLPLGYTIGDALKFLPQQKTSAPMITTPPFLPAEEKTSGGFLDTLKNIFGNVGVLDEIGGKIGEALKILPTLKPREIPKRDDATTDISKAPMITTPPFAPMDSPITGGRVPMTPPFSPTRENGSGFSLANLTQIIPSFKGNIGGFDILGGLTGGNIFGSFGALDGLGGKFPKQGKSPFSLPRISLGSFLNGLGKVGNFGTGSTKIGNVNNVPMVTTPPFAPTQKKSLGFSLTDITKIFPNFKGNIGGFDILGGLTGGNIFGSFGALDGLGGKFPKQGKSPFSLSRISLGSFLNGLGKVGNFGTDSTKIGNVNNVPMVTTPPFAPTQEKSSGFSLTDITKIFPNFKGNIGGFDILGGLTGGNIFGSFGALDGLGGKFPKQGKSPFSLPRISLGSFLNGLGKVGNFGTGSTKIGNVNNVPMVTTPPFAPTQEKSLGGFGATIKNVFGGFLGNLGNLSAGLSSGDEFGSLGNLSVPMTNSNSSGNSAPPEFNFTINVTVNGNADENTVRRGVEAALPAFDDWKRQWQEFQHDAARRSFA